MPSGRPKGAKNKRKYVSVSLAELNKVLKESSMVLVHPSYSMILGGIKLTEVSEGEEVGIEEEPEKLSFTIHK